MWRCFQARLSAKLLAASQLSRGDPWGVDSLLVRPSSDSCPWPAGFHGPRRRHRVIVPTQLLRGHARSRHGHLGETQLRRASVAPTRLGAAEPCCSVCIKAGEAMNPSRSQHHAFSPAVHGPALPRAQGEVCTLSHLAAGFWSLLGSRSRVSSQATLGQARAQRDLCCRAPDKKVFTTEAKCKLSLPGETLFTGI